jgi:hypothetical protein
MDQLVIACNEASCQIGTTNTAFKCLFLILNEIDLQDIPANRSTVTPTIHHIIITHEDA